MHTWKVAFSRHHNNWLIINQLFWKLNRSFRKLKCPLHKDGLTITNATHTIYVLGNQLSDFHLLICKHKMYYHQSEVVPYWYTVKYRRTRMITRQFAVITIWRGIWRHLPSISDWKSSLGQFPIRRTLLQPRAIYMTLATWSYVTSKFFTEYGLSLLLVEQSSISLSLSI
jgi:hypothetical protein